MRTCGHANQSPTTKSGLPEVGQRHGCVLDGLDTRESCCTCLHVLTQRPRLPDGARPPRSAGGRVLPLVRPPPCLRRRSHRRRNHRRRQPVRYGTADATRRRARRRGRICRAGNDHNGGAGYSGRWQRPTAAARGRADVRTCVNPWHAVGAAVGLKGAWRCSSKLITTTSMGRSSATHHT